MNTSMKVKMGARYIVLLFFMFLAHMITQPEWIVQVKEVDPMTLNVIYASVFGALTLIIKSHFETKPADMYEPRPANGSGK